VSVFSSRKRTPSTVFLGNERFRVLRPLGAGGMGEVYEVLDRERDARVALKVLRRSDYRFLSRFKLEFRTLQALQHPNLAVLNQLHEDAGAWFFTMELVEGVDFRRHVARGAEVIAACADTIDSDVSAAYPIEPVRPDPTDRRASFDEAALRNALAQLCNALAFLHDAGKIHRDIKPSNVLVTREGRVVLLDFGLVAEAGPDRDSLDGDLVGTPLYMAPEQATSQRPDHRVDCYAVGVMLYEILVGSPPFTGTLTEILIAKQCAAAPDPRDRADGIPDDLAILCMRLLAADPARRPSAAEVARLLASQESLPVAEISSGARAAVFVGRDTELAALRAAFDASLGDDHPRVIHLEAESGVGKSSLIAAFVSRLRAERPDVRVLAGRCYEREMTNYRAFDAVVDTAVRMLRDCDRDALAAATPGDAWLLTRMFPMFGSLPSFSGAAIAADAGSEQAARGRGYAAFCHVLRALARPGPLVIVVDDVQWADTDSLRLLAELLRGPLAPPILWVLASRPLDADDPRGSARQWLASALRCELGHLALAPLSTALARQLAEQLLDGSGSGSDAEAIAREAGGHPLHIAELVRHAASGGGSQHLRLDEAILQRLSRLPAPARELADVLALAGAPLRPLTLRRAAELSPLDFDRAVAVLRIGHLARRSGAADDELLEPYHDRVREAIAGRLDDDRRRHLHARVAAALTAGGAPSELLVRHLEGSGAHGRAAACAVDAAQRATASMAYDRAAELYQTALRLGVQSDAERRELRLRLGEVFVLAGRGREAADVLAQAADGADPEVRLHCRVQSAEQLLLSGHIDDGLRALAVVLGEVGTPLPATPARALVSLLGHRVALRLRGRGRGVTLRREAQIPREQLTRLDVYRAVGHGLSMVDNVRGAVFNSRSLRLARRLGEPLRLSRALGVEAMFLGSQGDTAGEQRVLDELADLAAAVDAPFSRAWLIAAEACRAYFGGRFLAAARTFGVAEGLCRETRTEASDVPSIRVLRGFSLMHAGELGQLRPLHEQWLAEAEQRGDLFLATVLRRGYALLALASGDIDSIGPALDRARWTTAEGSFHLQHWYEIQSRVELALCRGRADEVVATIDRCLIDLRRSHIARIQIVRCLALWLQARVHLMAARGPAALARASRLARRIVAKLHRERVSYAAIWAELLDATERTATGHRDEATAALRRAAALGHDDLQLYGLIARHRLARYVDGAESAALRAEVATTATRLGIDTLEPLAALFAPE
jgi:eukaryotic-like serine/threonine-protein kinase